MSHVRASNTSSAWGSQSARARTAPATPTAAAVERLSQAGRSVRVPATSYRSFRAAW